MISKNVPHNDFREGFVVGYQLVRGTNAAMPGVPGQPGIPGNSTPFLIGIQYGIAAAGKAIA